MASQNLRYFKMVINRTKSCSLVACSITFIHTTSRTSQRVEWQGLLQVMCGTNSHPDLRGKRRSAQDVARSSFKKPALTSTVIKFGTHHLGSSPELSKSYMPQDPNCKKEQHLDQEPKAAACACRACWILVVGTGLLADCQDTRC
eukprot:1284613-Amphidinium_carterae.1